MKRNLYVILIILAGVCGAVLRAMSLLHGYELDSGLPVEGYVPANILVVLTAILLIGAVLLSKIWFGSTNDYSFEEMFDGMPGHLRSAGILFGACVAGSGGVGVALLNQEVLEQSNEFVQIGLLTIIAIVAMWVLCILSGIAMMVLVSKQKEGRPATKRLGIAATLPMFWCCLDLIMVYHENSGNPVISDYSYTLLLVIAVMTAFYSIAGFFFSEHTAVKFFASAGIAVYLSLTYAGGAALSFCIGNTPSNWMFGDLIRLGAYLGVGAFLFVQLVHATSRATRKRA